MPTLYPIKEDCFNVSARAAYFSYAKEAHYRTLCPRISKPFIACTCIEFHGQIVCVMFSKESLLLITAYPG